MVNSVRLCCNLSWCFPSLYVSFTLWVQPLVDHVFGTLTDHRLIVRHYHSHLPVRLHVYAAFAWLLPWWTLCPFSSLCTGATDDVFVCVQKYTVCVFVSVFEHSQSLDWAPTHTHLLSRTHTYTQSHTWGSCKSFKACAESWEMF